MLKRFIVEVYKVIIVIRIDKITIAFGKGKATAHMQLRQHRIVRVADMKNFLSIKVQVFALLVTQIGISVFITDNLAWVFNLNSTMIGSDNYLNLFLR